MLFTRQVPGPGGCLVPWGAWSRGVPGLGGVSGPGGALSQGGAGSGGFWSQGGAPGPHPRGKLRGIRSRPTPKGEIEGN